MIDCALPTSESLTERDELLLSRRPDIGFKQSSSSSALKRTFGGFERSFVPGMNLVYSEPAYEAYVNR